MIPLLLPLTLEIEDGAPTSISFNALRGGVHRLSGGRAGADMLEIKNLKVCYDDVLAISDVSLRVEPGKIVALVGGNGNGKSTTLRAVAGLNSAAAGSITFKGQSIVACLRTSGFRWACHWCPKADGCFHA